MAVEDFETLHYKLQKRGFNRDDLLLHDCTACNEHAVATYKIAGRVGGRDISFCLACGASRSWRSGAGLQTREEDVGFDLRAFLA